MLVQACHQPMLSASIAQTEASHTHGLPPALLHAARGVAAVAASQVSPLHSSRCSWPSPSVPAVCTQKTAGLLQELCEALRPSAISAQAPSASSLPHLAFTGERQSTPAAPTAASGQAATPTLTPSSRPLGTIYIPMSAGQPGGILLQGAHAPLPVCVPGTNRYTTSIPSALPVYGTASGTMTTSVPAQTVPPSYLPSPLLLFLQSQLAQQQQQQPVGIPQVTSCIPHLPTSAGVSTQHTPPSQLNSGKPLTATAQAQQLCHSQPYSSTQLVQPSAQLQLQQLLHILIGSNAPSSKRLPQSCPHPPSIKRRACIPAPTLEPAWSPAQDPHAPPAQSSSPACRKHLSEAAGPACSSFAGVSLAGNNAQAGLPAHDDVGKIPMQHMSKPRRAAIASLPASVCWQCHAAGKSLSDAQVHTEPSA